MFYVLRGWIKFVSETEGERTFGGLRLASQGGVRRRQGNRPATGIGTPGAMSSSTVAGGRCVSTLR